MRQAYRAALDRKPAYQQDPVLSNYKGAVRGRLAASSGHEWTVDGDTALPRRTEARWAAAAHRRARGLQAAPARREGHRRPPRDGRDGKLPLDWGMAETLAYATLLAEGYGDAAVRAGLPAAAPSTHRHAVLHDQNRENWDRGTYVPLQHIDGRARPDFAGHRLGAVGSKPCSASSTATPCATPNTLVDLGGAVRRLRQRRAGR
jgi:2-oxoglutarate dehydrogenase E1 component